MIGGKRVEYDDSSEELARAVLSESEEGAAAYLRQEWLVLAMDALIEARRKSGLTQRDLATRMGTTQSSIARLERDLEGSVTLHRYVDYALACGVLPLVPQLKPLHELRQAALEDPGTSALIAGRPVTPWRSTIGVVKGIGRRLMGARSESEACEAASSMSEPVPCHTPIALGTADLSVGRTKSDGPARENGWWAMPQGTLEVPGDSSSYHASEATPARQCRCPLLVMPEGACGGAEFSRQLQCEVPGLSHDYCVSG